MTAAIRLSAIAAAVLIVLFFPFRFNAGAYADFKNKKFGAKIYLFNFVRLFKIDREADGLRLTLEGTINKQVDLLRDKMSSPKELFLLKALKIKALHVTILHDIMNYFSDSILPKAVMDMLCISAGPVLCQKLGACVNVNYAVGSEAVTAEGVFAVMPINVVILLLKKAVEKLWSNKTKFRKS